MAEKRSKKQTPKKTTNKKNKPREKVNKKIEKELKPKNYRVRAILLFASGIVFLCLMFIRGNFLWDFFRNSIFGLLGVPTLLISVLLFYVAILTAKEKEIHRLKMKMSLSILIIVLAQIDFYIFTGSQYGNYFVELGRTFMQGYDADGVFSSGGGLMGAILGYPLSYCIGNTISAILINLAIAVILLIVTGGSLLDIARVAKKPVVAVRKQVAIRKEKNEVNKEIKPQSDVFYAPHYTDSIDIPIDDDKPRKKKKKNKELDVPKVNSSEEQPMVDKDNEENIIDIIKRANKSGEDTVTDSVKSSGKTQALLEAAKQMGAEAINEETKLIDEEIKKAEHLSTSKYKYPPIQLLKLANNANSANMRSEMEEKAEKLVSTLDSFGVKVRITNICRGPSVTRYELQPAPGVKISKITNLADDIALNLAANGVRIEAPIPGKAAVGIEVPNKVVSMVSMRELIDSDTFKNSDSKLTCVLGRDISGEIVTTDLAKMPHLLIAGTTGSGKSVCVNSLLMSILYRATPDEVKFLLIDPKMVEFSKYKGIPHLLVPVVSDAKKAAAALNWAVSEMLQRYKLFSEYDCKDINSYNDLIESNLKFIAEQDVVEGEEPEVMEINGLPVPKEKMFRCIIAIDELADLMMAAPSEVEESICRLAQMARAAGMHLVIATQRPSVNVITGVIKANIPSRISLKVSSNIDSRTILDFGGAEKLIGRGDMLYSPVGAPKPIRVQGCYASDSEIEGVTNYIKKNYRSQYNEEIEEKIKKITVEGMEADSSASNDSGLDLDDKIEEAIKIVIDAGQASTSLVQRRLKVGYARAGRMIDEMESLGIVGPHQGSKPRDVLMTYQEWLERKNITGNGASTVENDENGDDLSEE